MSFPTSEASEQIEIGEVSQQWIHVVKVLRDHSVIETPHELPREDSPIVLAVDPGEVEVVIRRLTELGVAVRRVGPGPSATAAGTSIPIHRGDNNGYTIRLREGVDHWRDVNRVEGLLMLNSASVGKMDKASLVAGAPILTGVPEAELQSLVAQFAERGIAVNVDRDSSLN